MEWIAAETERMADEMGELETEISAQRHNSEGTGTCGRRTSIQKKRKGIRGRI
jgi:hypothetical protein